MKKSLIATGAASLALAAMPVLGAFADVTDTVVLTINSSCSVGQSSATGGGGKTIEQTAVNNHLYTWDADGTQGGTIKVTCNDAGGWQVKAVGSSTGSPVTSMAGTNGGTSIATGTAESGTTSNWMFKVAGTGAASSYTNWAAIPATATVVASGTGAISEGSINTGYQVWVSATQPAGTYTGKVTYTANAAP